jgi:hypothetical protein
VRGMPRVEHVEQLCDTCVVTKQRRRPFLRQASYRAQEKLDSHCAGQSRRRPPVDGVSSSSSTMCHCSCLHHGSHCERHQVHSSRRGGVWLQVRVLRTDNDSEFTACCADEGIQRHSLPRTPRSRTTLSSAAIRRWWPRSTARPPRALTARHHTRLGTGASQRSSTYASSAVWRCERVQPRRQTRRPEHARVFIGYADGIKAYRILDPVT